MRIGDRSFMRNRDRLSCESLIDHDANMQYGACAAEKLRRERQFCHSISIYIRSSPYAINEVPYGNIATERPLTLPQDTRNIASVAMRALKRILRDVHAT
ncbi:DinB/UmuC family translesion DNA polymerase [Sodalis praecaptivus]|uniref:DinB/UmuC family translesion DNA polymerase n=1 Tax=Sodalis praecaptivus TaxID=1239307 RepID=UPI0037DA2ABF